jgi:hypothetical protein
MDKRCEICNKPSQAQYVPTLASGLKRILHLATPSLGALFSLLLRTRRFDRRLLLCY